MCVLFGLFIIFAVKFLSAFERMNFNRIVESNIAVRKKFSRENDTRCKRNVLNNLMLRHGNLTIYSKEVGVAHGSF